MKKIYILLILILGIFIGCEKTYKSDNAWEVYLTQYYMPGASFEEAEKDYWELYLKTSTGYKNPKEAVRLEIEKDKAEIRLQYAAEYNEGDKRIKNLIKELNKRIILFNDYITNPNNYMETKEGMTQFVYGVHRSNSHSDGEFSIPKIVDENIWEIKEDKNGKYLEYRYIPDPTIRKISPKYVEWKKKLYNLK